MRSKLFYFQSLIIFLLLTIFSAKSTLGQGKSSLEKNVNESDMICIGKVVKMSSYWNKDKTCIWTDIKLKCSEFLKGKKSNNEITIRVLGGEVEVDDIGMDVSGSPKFNVSDSVLVFLVKDIEDKYAVRGWEEGKYKFSNGHWINRGVNFPREFIQEIKDIVKQGSNN